MATCPQGVGVGFGKSGLVDVGSGATCAVESLVGVIVAPGSGALVTIGECVGMGEGEVASSPSPSVLPLAHPADPAMAMMPAKASAISLGRIMESPLWSPQMGRPVW